MVYFSYVPGGGVLGSLGWYEQLLFGKVVFFTVAKAGTSFANIVGDIIKVMASKV